MINVATLTTKTPASEIRKIAKSYGVTLEGDLRRQSIELCRFFTRQSKKGI